MMIKKINKLMKILKDWYINEWKYWRISILMNENIKGLVY